MVSSETLAPEHASQPVRALPPTPGYVVELRAGLSSGDDD
jgi:hypothetical protein